MAPWNQTSNSELPFLRPTKIFIRTIRSSDKASTKAWGPCVREGRMCQQDVFTATLYTQTTGLLSSIWDTAATLFAPSQARWHHASKPRLTHPHFSHHPSRPCSVLAPGQYNLAAQHAYQEEGGARAIWLLSRKLGLISDAQGQCVTEGGFITFGFISFTTTGMHRLSLDLISDKWVSDHYPMVRAPNAKRQTERQTVTQT